LCRSRYRDPDQQQETPDLIGIPEAAAILAVDDHTIRRQIAAGRLPAYRVGTKIIRLRREDVEKLLVPVLPE
jgi:excisionase family DNA binding protein